MKVFDHPNMLNFLCPICKTAEDKPVVLVEIGGTREGYKAKAEQIHLACIELTAWGGPEEDGFLIQAI